MTYRLKCADCGREKNFEARTLRGILELARSDGWAIKRDNSIQWCANCADKHRHVGKGGATKYYVEQLPGQLSIDEI